MSAAARHLGTAFCEWPHTCGGCHWWAGYLWALNEADAGVEAQLATARAEERERCAKAAEAVKLPDRWLDGSGLSHSERCAADDAAGLIVDAIRALTPTPEPPHD